MAYHELWDTADAAQKKKTENAVYNLASGNDSGKKLQARIDEGKSAGIDTVDVLLAQLALLMSDKPNSNNKLGTYTDDERKAALLSLPDLTDDERNYLWLVLGGKPESVPAW